MELEVTPIVLQPSPIPNPSLGLDPGWPPPSQDDTPFQSVERSWDLIQNRGAIPLLIFIEHKVEVS